MTRPAYAGRWKQIRLTVLRRDGYRCRIGGPGCTVHATHVDHIVPWDKGGSRDPQNLRAACAHCNSSRGDGTRTRRYRSEAQAPSRNW